MRILRSRRKIESSPLTAGGSSVLLNEVIRLFGKKTIGNQYDEIGYNIQLRIIIIINGRNVFVSLKQRFKKKKKKLVLKHSKFYDRDETSTRCNTRDVPSRLFSIYARAPIRFMRNARPCGTHAPGPS